MSTSSQALQRAVDKHRRGKTRAALAIARGVIRRDPEQASAQHLVGCLLIEEGQPHDALLPLGEACRLEPGFAPFHGMRGVALAQVGETEEALVAFDRALGLDENHEQSRLNKAVALLKRNGYEEAERCLRILLERHPHSGKALVLLGQALLGQRRSTDAVEYLERGIHLLPEDAHGWTCLGKALVMTGRDRYAEECLQRALRLVPGSAMAHCTMALLRMDAWRWEEASVHLGIAERIDPGDPTYRDLRATLHANQWELEEAEACFRALIESHPDMVPPVAGLAGVLHRRHRNEEAWALLEPVLHHFEAFPKVLLTAGPIALKLGRIEVVLEPLQRLARETERSDHRSLAWQQVGECMEALARHDEAFEAYRRSNDARGFTFNPQLHQLGVQALEKAYSAEAMSSVARIQSPDHPGPTPVFVVGMPRSGTSLTEQILAAHGKVHGAGELKTLGGLVHGLHERVASSYEFPHCVPLLTEPVLRDVAHEYRETLAEHARNTSATRVVDKMPQNFQLVGLATLLMPGATLIATERRAADVALSCFFQAFKA
ncbi:MAG: tetratricopeptide repeat protein, partial [Myxococcota bacterium]|nr:tetratricopeptide repeat protein [Myxococcota bacterium]